MPAPAPTSTAVKMRGPTRRRASETAVENAVYQVSVPSPTPPSRATLAPKERVAVVADAAGKAHSGGHRQADPQGAAQNGAHDEQRHRAHLRGDEEAQPEPDRHGAHARSLRGDTAAVAELRSVLIEDLTWPEVQGALADGVTTALVACAATEQHGPHLPTATDTILGREIAIRAARRAGTALVAPVVRPGLSEHHMHFPGSFTLRPETFLAVLEDLCDSLARQGFRRVVVFPSHGGNSDMLRAYLPTLGRRLEGRADVGLGLMAAGFDDINRAVAEHGVSIGRAGAHAGYVETCMMLAVAPELVREEAFEPGRCDDEFYAPENIRNSQMEAFLKGIQTQAPNGVLGDPTGATAEVGEELLDLAAAQLAADL